MLDWLIDSTDLFGLPTQNWMLLVGGGLLLYIGALSFFRGRQPGTH